MVEGLREGRESVLRIGLCEFCYPLCYAPMPNSQS